MIKYSILLITIINALVSYSQEYTGHSFIKKNSDKKLKKATVLTLPIRDDFSYYDSSTSPSESIWIDYSTYVNNHFSTNHYNKGMVTLDGLNAEGVPYDPNAGAVVNGDSLTTHPIDLSTWSLSDNLWLSFQYLPGGLGYKPRPTDSILIYFNDGNTGWNMVDYIIGDSINYWRYKMIPIADNNYYNENFQVRIINKCRMGISSSHWHIDNFYINANRGTADTVHNDIAFTVPSTNLLNDLTAMPFKHFNSNKNSFVNSRLIASLHNRQMNPFNMDVKLNVKNATTNTLLSSSIVPKFLNTLQADTISFPMINTSLINADADGDLKLKLVYSYPSLTSDYWRRNDSIIHVQEFKDYFAYDDGSSEKSYFINLFPGAPGKIATEFKNYVADTIAGVDLQFANVTPSQASKEFFIQIYKGIVEGGSGGELIYQQEGFFPAYTSDNSGFVRYAFNETVPLGTGNFFVVIMMPAGGVSDSLMIGLDVNRVGGNHRLYSVEDIWINSTIEGALMLRPVMSGTKLPTTIENNPVNELNVNIYPNPTSGLIQIIADVAINRITVMDQLGKEVASIEHQDNIDISHLSNGLYYITITAKEGTFTSKVVKQ